MRQTWAILRWERPDTGESYIASSLDRRKPGEPDSGWGKPIFVYTKSGAWLASVVNSHGWEVLRWSILSTTDDPEDAREAKVLAIAADKRINPAGNRNLHTGAPRILRVEDRDRIRQRDSARARCLALLEKYGDTGFSVTDASVELGCSPSHVSEALVVLERDGIPLERLSRGRYRLRRAS